MHSARWERCDEGYYGDKRGRFLTDSEADFGKHANPKLSRLNKWVPDVERSFSAENHELENPRCMLPFERQSSRYAWRSTRARTCALSRSNGRTVSLVASSAIALVFPRLAATPPNVRVARLSESASSRCFVGHRIPLPEEVNARNPLNSHRPPAARPLRIVRLDHRIQPRPRHHPLHLTKKSLPPRHLLRPGIFGLAKLIWCFMSSTSPKL